MNELGVIFYLGCALEEAFQVKTETEHWDANGWLRRGGEGGLEEEEEEEAEKKRAVGGLVGKGRGLERREEPWRGRRRRSEFLFLVHCTAETLGRYGKLFGEEKEKKGVELVLLRAGLGTPSIHLSLNQIWAFFI